MVMFLGDGEFDGTKRQAKGDGYGWHDVCRTAKDTLLTCDSARPSQVGINAAGLCDPTPLSRRRVEACGRRTHTLANPFLCAVRSDETSPGPPLARHLYPHHLADRPKVTEDNGRPPNTSFPTPI